MGVSAQPLVPSDGNRASHSLLSPTNIHRLKGIPVFLISSSESAVYSPEATELSYDLLTDTFGEEGYERMAFEGKGYADIWMGEGGREVWEEVRRRVDEVCRA